MGHAVKTIFPSEKAYLLWKTPSRYFKWQYCATFDPLCSSRVTHGPVVSRKKWTCAVVALTPESVQPISVAFVNQGRMIGSWGTLASWLVRSTRSHDNFFCLTTLTSLCHWHSNEAFFKSRCLRKCFWSKMSALRPFLFILLCAAAPGALSKTNQIGDLCVPNPCQNGGVCSAINGSTVLCDCSQGFTGAQCQWRTTQCKDNPCKHGICQLDQNNSPQCFCVPGYTGKYCENNHNECASQPCRNGATCIDEVNDFRCICEAGSFGRHCEMLDEHIKDFVRRCDDGSICWRNGSIQTSTSWGYGDGICSTQHSCFGGQNDSSTNTFDRLIDVQLKPLQIQIGDSMNFTADEEMASSSDGFQVYRAFDEDSSGFRTCNETDGKLISQEPQESVLVGPDILTPGLNYFYVNLDTIFRCEFGLRLNVSVKGNHCYNSSSDGSELCSGRGQCHTNFSLPDYRCKCCDGFRGEYCEKLDHCFPKPCKNGAECKNIDGDPGNGEPYVCVCRPGYEGRDCSIITDKCLSSPCRNGAQCVPKVNDFSCVCPHGYTGKTCAVDINECDSNPCQNGATCQDALSSYSCTCKPGFAGTCSFLCALQVQRGFWGDSNNHTHKNCWNLIGVPEKSLFYTRYSTCSIPVVICSSTW